MPLAIDLTSRRAIVTGVTSGIGAGIAIALAEAGCDVAGCGLENAASDGARMFVASVERLGRRAIYRATDFSHADAPSAFVDHATRELGGIDIVVSNAGRNVFRGAADCSESDWADCIDLDLASHWRLAKASRPQLQQTTGVVIFIGSNHAVRTLPGCFPYNVAKAGISALTQSLAIEWGPTIRTVAIAPGFIETPGNDAWFNSFSDPAAERAATRARHPVGRLGTPRDVGVFCAFLASDMAGFISGTTIRLDGGRSALLQDVSTTS